MVIRTHIPWQGYLLGGVLLLLLMGALGVLLVHYSGAGMVGQELQGLREQLYAQSREIEALRASSGTVQSVANIERASQQKVLARLQFLEQENAALKEDMLLFERLLPSAGEESVLRIENFRVVRDAPAALRYRCLLVYQGGRQLSEFRGYLQFVIDYSLDGKVQRVVLPEGRYPSAGYSVELKRFLRRDGVLDIPSGAIVGRVEVRLLQGDVVKARAEVQL
ncbi:DUF6776 family protein [Azonexus sp. IMCC34839]|uniref:DUF6776 family protein n=1 Tax=Azonexus sp. IMCC34839 TaxID=3133695 RepID=UPI00399A319B